MDAIEIKLREQLVEVCQLLWDAGLVTGSAGNVSVRIPGTNKCIIKPTGFRLCDLKPEEFTVVDIKTREILSGELAPSTETPFHATLYSVRADIGGIVHNHSYYATLFSIAGIELVPMGMILYSAPPLAKGIGISKYALPGTEDLALNIAEEIKDKDAVLLPHHGVLTVGTNVMEAFKVSKGVEDLAKLQFDLMRISKPQPLPDVTLQRILERYEKRMKSPEA